MQDKNLESYLTIALQQIADRRSTTTIITLAAFIVLLSITFSVNVNLTYTYIALFSSGSLFVMAWVSSMAAKEDLLTITKVYKYLTVYRENTSHVLASTEPADVTSDFKAFKTFFLMNLAEEANGVVAQLDQLEAKIRKCLFEEVSEPTPVLCAA